MSEYRTIAGQQLIDVSMQELGDAGRLYELAKFNGMLPSTLLATNAHLVVPTAEANKLFIVNKLRQVNPATSNVQLDELNKQGIGYWKIGSTFKVS